jgi:hypothetical protein
MRLAPPLLLNFRIYENLFLDASIPDTTKAIALARGCDATIVRGTGGMAASIAYIRITSRTARYSMATMQVVSRTTEGTTTTTITTTITTTAPDKKNGYGKYRENKDIHQHMKFSH